MARTPSCLAVIAARNDAPYLEVLLPALLEDGIEVALLDHSSRDGTQEVARPYLGHGVVSIDHLPYEEYFRLGAQLLAKERAAEASNHEWLIHLDADEWIQTRSGEALPSLLAEIPDRCVAVNLDEFVFLPAPGFDALGTDFRQTVTHYYFFEPVPLRLQRIWRHHRGLRNLAAGGHTLGVDEEALLPESQSLRHYVALSYSHAWLKRAERHYEEDEIARGWHHNRLRLESQRPDSPRYASLHRAHPWDDPRLDRSSPCRHHYWEWERRAEL